MTDRYLLESGSPDGYLLEDGSGVLLLDFTPAVSTLADDFDDNSLDATKWTVDQFLDGVVTGVTVAETSQQLQVTGIASAASVRYSGYVSVGTYSLDSVFVKWLHATVQTSEVFYLGAGQDANNAYYALVDSGTLFFTKRVAGVNSNTNLGAWSATTHAWVQLRWGGTGDDTVYLDTATSSASDPPVSGDWTNRASAARDPAINLAACKLAIGGGTYASVAVPTVFKFDGFNTATTSGTNVALTGQSVSASLGSVTASTSLGVTGSPASIAQGTVLQGAPLVGQAISIAQGSAAPATSVALTGQALTAARGTVTATTANALSGQTAAIGQGSVLQGAPITGQNTTVAIGSAAPVVSIALTGQALTGSVGSVSPAASLALSGQALTAGRGSVAASPSLGLTGQGVAAARGSVLASSSIALTGSALTVGQGTVTAAAPGVAALTGQSIVTTIGTASPGISVALTGQSIGTAQNGLGAAYGIGIAGQQTTSTQGAFIFAVSPSLVGQEIAVSQFAALLSETVPEPKFWNLPPLTGRRISVGRSR